MSIFEDFLYEYSSSDVEIKTLGELGEFYNGLTGKSKDDFKGGNAKFISYMNVYSNLEVKTDTIDRVKIGTDENQKIVQLGDILFTGSSETLNECGMSSVLTSEPNEPLYLNSFCFGFRLFDKSLLLPGFSKYLFRSEAIRKQIMQTANGVTRFNVSKKRMTKVRIPLPSIPIQKEIVKILDTFSEFETELEIKLNTELDARKKQYEYYRDALLTFRDNVEWKTLGEIGTVIRGNGLQKKDFIEEGIGCIHYGQIYTFYGTFANKTKSFVSENLASKLKKAQHGDVLISGVSENIEDVCTPLGWLGGEICISGDMFAFRHNQNTKFITYILKTTDFQKYKEKFAQGAKVIRVKKERILDYKIPIPSLSEQERIVAIIDKFDVLLSNISVSLLAELNARRKQYEYYRNKLLTFKPLEEEYAS